MCRIVKTGNISSITRPEMRLKAAVRPSNMRSSNIASTVPREQPPVRARRHGLLRRAVLQLRDSLIDARIWYLRTIMKMDIHPEVRISLKAKLDLTNPRGIHIAEGTYVTFNAVILAHDMSRVRHVDTYIGRNCFIGAAAIIMPGVRIGDECIVGSGAVVTKDVPSHSIVAGNPAVVLRSGIRMVKWGILEDAYRDALAESASR